MHPYEVLRRPLVTEKVTRQGGQNKYAFAVAMDANKVQIKEAVEKAFKVTVVAVNTSHVRGKERRLGRTKGFTPDWKRAVVTLQEGQKIEAFEGA